MSEDNILAELYVLAHFSKDSEKNTICTAPGKVIFF